MALTSFQRAVCQLIAANRIAQGESYVAGGVALNTLTGGTRISRDIDLFHDSEVALDAAWRLDRDLLRTHGYDVDVLRERPSFVEAKVARDDQSVLLQWARDSAYRFFPLIRHEDFGLVLHPFDLATNKVLALVGRLEVRDWVDLIQCHARVQALGFLAWAACGKDPGYNPAMILAQAGRSSRYSAAEVAELAFAGPPPDAGELSRTWRGMLAEAEEIIGALPPAQCGTCVLHADGTLFSGTIAALRAAAANHTLLFHAGHIRGAYPQVVT